MSDAALDWLVVVLPIILSLVGIWLTVKRKGWWGLGLMVFGIILSFLTWNQQSRARHAQSLLQQQATANQLHIQESQRQVQESQRRIESIVNGVDSQLGVMSAAKPQARKRALVPEPERRRTILGLLQQEYILSL